VRLLVITTVRVSARQLRDAIRGEITPEDAEVMVVAPALHDSPRQFWLSDADEAIATAQDVQRATQDQLDAAGIAARGDTGESDPLTAIEDALESFPAERIVLFRPPQSRQRYREGVDASEIEQRFHVPVDMATVEG
jgi:hypothetical protein